MTPTTPYPTKIQLSRLRPIRRRPPKTALQFLAPASQSPPNDDEAEKIKIFFYRKSFWKLPEPKPKLFQLQIQIR